MEEKKFKVYICLPITGKDLEKQMKQSAIMEKWLEDRGMQAVNPLKNGLAPNAPREKHMKADIKLLLECDALLPMRGWKYSSGCKLEMNIAIQTGKTIMFTPEEDSLYENLTKAELPF